MNADVGQSRKRGSMVKRLISLKNRGGLLLHVSIAAVSTIIATCCLPSESLAFGPLCFQGSAGQGAVPCSDPSATTCHTDGDPSVCGDYGSSAVGPDDFMYCVEPTCTSSLGASVPELEDYAAALFLGLALLTGWQVRRKFQSVA